MNMAKLILTFILLLANSLFSQMKDDNSYINHNRMQKLDSLKFELYKEFNLTYQEIKSMYLNSIVMDTTIYSSDTTEAETEGKILITDSLLIGIGKSRKTSEWHLRTLYFKSQNYFSKFNLQLDESYDSFLTKYDSTDSYKSSSDNNEFIKYFIDIKDTDEFIYFTEFTFYFVDRKLKNISIDFLENR
ncbi:MAG TPA: hypothetical protein PKX68_09885 [Ignavibacteriaceae bacterium]|nr:hypothetical protein [Ignavibacteriaceae bacterium]